MEKVKQAVRKPRAARRAIYGALFGAAILALSGGAAPSANAVGSTAPALQPSDATLRWLGNAGWEIRYAGSVILVDPWITRKEIPKSQEWRTDEAAVSNVITGADYIFVTHSHVDHVADVPFIAKRFGSKVYGSATTTNLALSSGVDSSQLSTIKGGEKFDLGGFSVQVIESLHETAEGATPGTVRTIDKPPGRPIQAGDFVDGGTYLYLFTFGAQRILDQGSGNFRMDRLAGLQPDLILMVPNYTDYDLKTALTALKPKGIIAHHWDAWRDPYQLGITDQNTGRARRFRTDARAVISQVGFTIPQYFQAMTLNTQTGNMILGPDTGPSPQIVVPAPSAEDVGAPAPEEAPSDAPSAGDEPGAEDTAAP